MADTLKRLGKGTLGTSSGTLYTTPALTTTIVKEITLCNKSGSAATASILFDGAYIVGAKSIGATDTIIVELHSVMSAGTLITGLAGTGSAIDYYISGVEIS